MLIWTSIRAMLIIACFSWLGLGHGEGHDPQSPVNISGGYSRERADLDDQHYGVTHGAWLSGDLHLSQGSMINIGLNLAYLGEWRNAELIPSIDQFTGQMSSEGVENTSVNTTFNRPEETSTSLGRSHRFSLGFNLHRVGKQSDLIGHFGGVWEIDETHSMLFDLWGCLRGNYGALWMSLIYNGDACLGQKQARIRALVGGNIGRASLGVGWGFSNRHLISDQLVEGGPMTWLLLPLSAPLYLEMSVWYTNGTPLSETYSDQTREGKLFMVSLKWTGESESKELAPSPSKSTSPSNNPSKPSPSQSSPLFNPSSPLGPAQPTQSPSTPL